MKIYIVSNTENGTDDINGIYFLVTEQGKLLDGIWCSEKSYAIGDSSNNEIIKKYKKQFGDFEVIYLGEDNMTMSEILELNKKFCIQNGAMYYDS